MIAAPMLLRQTSTEAADGASGVLCDCKEEPGAECPMHKGKHQSSLGHGVRDIARVRGWAIAWPCSRSSPAQAAFFSPPRMSADGRRRAASHWPRSPPPF